MSTSENIAQIFGNNPVPSLHPTDLLYLGRSPYGINDDAAIEAANLTPATQLVYVALNGSDTDGNGSPLMPYQTISHAMTQITTASAATPYAITLLDNSYTEANAILWKPNVSLFGPGQGCTVSLTTGISLDLTTWNALSGNALVCFEGVSLQSISTAVTFDFTTLSTTDPAPSIIVNNATINGFLLNMGALTFTSVSISNSSIGNPAFSNFLLNSKSTTYSNFIFGSSSVALTTAGAVNSSNDIYLGDVNLLTPATGSLTNTFNFSAASYRSPSTVTVSGVQTFFSCDAVTYSAFSPSLSVSVGATLTLVTGDNGVKAIYSPSNYTPTDNTVNGNLHGIDNKFGSLSAVYSPTYIQGCTLTYATNETLTISTGVAVDSTGTTLITSAGYTLDFTASGANGLDTGVITSNKIYYIYLIEGTSGTTSTASLSFSGPALPAGYTKSRRIGTWQSILGSVLAIFMQRGNYNRREYFYAGPRLAASAGGFQFISGVSGPVTPLTVDLSPYIPPSNISVTLQCSLTTSTAGNFQALRNADSANYEDFVVCQAATIPFYDVRKISLSTTQQFTYQSSDTLDINYIELISYEEEV